MSAKRTSMIAIGIAALMVLCAITGAVIYNNSNNNISNDSDSNTLGNNIASFTGSLITSDADTSDVGASTMTVRTTMTPLNASALSGTGTVTYLPEDSDDLIAKLSSRANSDTLLMDFLKGKQFMLDGKANVIRSTEDAAKYLYSTGLTVFGQSLVPLAVNACTDACLYQMSDISVANAQVEMGKMDSTAFNRSVMTAELKEARADLELVRAESVIADAADCDIAKITLRQFVNGEWFSTSDNQMIALYTFLNSNEDSDAVLLDVMAGTPFAAGDNSRIIIVKDVDDLSMFIYGIGFEVIANNVLTDGFAYKAAAPRTAYFAVNDTKNYVNDNSQARVLLAASNCFNSCSGFLFLGEMCVGDFLYADLVQVGYGMDKADLVASYLSRCSMLNMLQLEKCDRDNAAVDAVRIRGASLGGAAVGSVESETAMKILIGTVFADAEGNIIIVSDAQSYAQFLDSLGLVVKNNSLYYFSYMENGVVSSRIASMTAYEMYDVLVEGDCFSFAPSLQALQMGQACADKDMYATAIYGVETVGTMSK